MNNWTEIIKPKKNFFSINLKEVFQYKDLLFMFVKRDFVAQYKQTLLGPAWFFIQPLLTTFIFSFVFGGIAKISTGGQPKVLFYLSGLTIWNYFAECLNRTSTVFISNANIFGKVYFPRLISPLSIIVSGLMRFGVQFILFLIILSYFLLKGDVNGVVRPNYILLLFPLLIFLMAGYAMGLGMIISSLTTKYKDLIQLISFGITLLMYATPIIYSVNEVPEEYKFYVMLNPIAPIVEFFRYGFIGTGMISFIGLMYSFFFMVLILFIGVLIFNKVEKTFMDTI